MTHYLRILMICLIIASFLLLAPACGGGGGGGGDSGPGGNPANVQLEVAPQRIDSGDRTNIKIRIQDTDLENFDTLTVKVRYPSGMSFVGGTAILTRRDKEEIGLPAREFTSDEVSYLVLPVETQRLRGEESAEINLLLEGDVLVEDGRIAIDADAGDPDDIDTFSTSNPQFSSLDEKRIDVLDDSSG